MKKVVGNVFDRVLKRLEWAAMFLFRFSPYLVAVAVPFAYEYSGEVITVFLMYACAYFLKEIYREISPSGINGIPIRDKRYTWRDSNGNVCFKISDLYGMADYLAEVEEWSEMYGVSKNGKGEIKREK